MIRWRREGWGRKLGKESREHESVGTWGLKEECEAVAAVKRIGRCWREQVGEA